MDKPSRHAGLKVAVVCSHSGQGAMGGAERFYHALLEALLEKGCDAHRVSVPADETTFEQILDNYEYCRNLDLSSFDLVISTKAPTYAVQHPNHVLYLVHTTRVFYDMFEENFPRADKVIKQQSKQIQALDTQCLANIPRRFCIGHEVKNRLQDFNGLDSEVLHPPLGYGEFTAGITGDYFFIPGRLHRWKRLHLLIEAVKLSSLPLKLKIAGSGEAADELKALAGQDERIEFCGRVAEEELIELYANCLAVPFVPIREDYGYVTLEAFSSAKPVITCTDSGEPTHFVEHGSTGLICEPSPESVSAALETLFNDPARAQTMGQKAQSVVDTLQWSRVAEQLLDAGAQTSARTDEHTASAKTKVAVIDMQPIDPPVGGGRLRLLGLYHNLGPDFETRYVGSYDWEGESYRRHRLSDSLEEIDVPLSKEHHLEARKLGQACGEKIVIDVAFPLQGHLSQDFLQQARSQIQWADVVVFSHPWIYPLLADAVKPSQTLIYDSHNVESYLRAQILDQSSEAELSLLHNIIETERDMCAAADAILACSNDDIDIFHRIYDLSARTMKLVPNGVFAESLTPPNTEKKRAARKALGLKETANYAIFIGSSYAPNVEAARFIASELAPRVSGTTFVIAGGVGASIEEELASADNVSLTGFLEEEEKLLWLQAADLAVNPMFSGSGTNIKMFDFLAAGLPTISTDIGARGIESPGGKAVQIVSGDSEDFAASIESVFADSEYRESCSRAARDCVEQGYAWENISPYLGSNILKVRKDRLHGRRTFSVVIPTYERHDQLEQLITCLREQSYKFFEVVIVDQSAMPWKRAQDNFSFPLQYIHTPIKGAVRARNTGASYASGEIIAFTDDDCRPDRGWLENSLKYFSDPDTVSVEGRIYSDRKNDATYRPVTNEGFEGFGFMTANLLVRNSAFKLAGAFDLAFDSPHFREDTDLGWRLLKLGRIPYAEDVSVFHPAQLRDNIRESLEERAKFFEKDALLFKKHPEKYKELFFAEGQWKRDEGFWENFLRGAKNYNVGVAELYPYLPVDKRELIEAE